MKLRNILLILAAITLGFASCSSESDILSEIDTPVNGLDEETVAVSFNISNGVSTKATQDANDSEASIDRCLIAIFSSNDHLLLFKKEFEASELVPVDANNLNSGYTTKTPIVTKAIPSDVIVIANCDKDFFKDVIYWEDFQNKLIEDVVADTDTKVSHLKARNLIKFGQTQVTPSKGGEIRVSVAQLAARIDLDLKFVPSTLTHPDTKIEVTSVEVKNINCNSHLFSTNNLPVKLDSYTSDFNNYIIKSEVSSNQYTSVLSCYSYRYESSTEPLTLSVKAKIIYGEDERKGQEKELNLRDITVNPLAGGYLYKVQGYIMDESLSLNYEVVEREAITVIIPDFE